ncbi:FAD-dependent oxidoreductase [Pandoraea commovens]|uniref:Kynurenine 3-monooxygenase n=1 Tax=Pandoraea commovens TaxID=2508289 RepID=A0A5E4X1K8_9BURK|nr:NAD(P)/FAD-dependent oxidoreductase [Pandoraea commovens]VVE30143.1 Kynurenine 3-monooxygenase [Pandoraea commovens]
MSQKPVIVIAGAGPAGLVAANMLSRDGFDVTVFETDASATSRDQGGMLDLHVPDGQLALKKAGLFDAYMAIARHDDQELRDIDWATGETLLEDIPAPGTGDSPEIDRLVLRELLLEPLPAGTVIWGARVVGVGKTSGGRRVVHLQDGHTHECDLVIGADGAGSAIRAALTDIRPVYTGVTFVELWFSDVERQHPAVAALVGHGTLMSVGNGSGSGTALFAQRNGNDVIRSYAAFRTHADDTDRPEKTLAGITQQDLLARFPGWSPRLLSLIEDAERIAAIRPIVGLPPGARWPATPGLTLVGDAAHVMPPMGVGVNLAMLDAAELAETIAGASDWQAAVHAQEAAMLDRSGPIGEQCASAFAEWFGHSERHALPSVHPHVTHEQRR